MGDKEKAKIPSSVIVRQKDSRFSVRSVLACTSRAPPVQELLSHAFLMGPGLLPLLSPSDLAVLALLTGSMSSTAYVYLTRKMLFALANEFASFSLWNEISGRTSARKVSIGTSAKAVLLSTSQRHNRTSVYPLVHVVQFNRLAAPTCDTRVAFVKSVL